MQTTGPATISGTATDPRGALNHAAMVTIHNADTGLEEVFPTHDYYRVSP